MNNLKNLNIERNPTQEKNLVDKNNLSNHGKMNTLTARKEKYISTKFYIDHENIILQYSQRKGSQQDN